MKNEKVYKIDILGSMAEVRVIDNQKGRYMCVFNKNIMSAFLEHFKAYGFMVCTESEKYGKLEYYPIEVDGKSKLTQEIMHNTWGQIKNNFPDFAN